MTPLSPEPSTEFWDELRAQYQSPPRFYHDYNHVLSVLSNYRLVATELGWQHPQEVYAAILFHDAVYEVGRRDNETLSAELAKEKNRRGLVQMISPDYTDARGNDRDAIEDMFRFYFLRAGDIALLTRIEELTVYGDSAADLLLTVGMAGRTDGVLGFNADAYRFEMELERDGDDWLLIGARWGELGEELK